MDHLIDQIRGTLDAGFPYAALMLALSAPDVCASLELPIGATPGHQKKRYLRWYRTHLGSRIPLLTAEDCYSIRCGVVHEGRMGNKDQQFGRIYFTMGDGQISAGNITIGDQSSGRLAGISLPIFCDEVIGAMQDWFSIAQADPNVQRNLSRMVRFYESGFPIFGGLMVMSSGTECIG